MRPALPGMAVAVFASLAAMTGIAGAQTPADKDLLFDEQKAFAYSQRAIGRTLSNHVFAASDGRTIRMADYRGKPLVISLIFTSCYQTCPTIVQTLARATEAAQTAFGRDRFNIVTIGFDSRVDTPARMRSYARSQGIDLKNWDFLSADYDTIERLSAEVGFIFLPSPRGFDHLTQTTVVTGDGRIYRQVYGSDFLPPTLIEPVKELVMGREPIFSSLSALAERVRLICTIYDPSKDRYRFSYGIFVSLVIGVFSLGGVAVFILRNLGRTRTIQG